MGRHQVLDKYILSDKGRKKEPPGIEIKTGRDLSTNESVTVKIFDTSTFFFLHGGVRELIKFEVSTMSRLDHPNVVRLVDVLASTCKIFMIMEAVSGGSGLHEAIAVSTRLEHTVAGSYFRQLLDAVEHCHSRGVCHRDIQPANVLLDSQGSVKLTGFALAGMLDPSIGDGQVKQKLLHAPSGVPDFAAPEVVQGLAYDGKAADIWSLGVTLYTMLAGYLPFQGESHADILNTALAGGFKHAPGITPSARALLDGMLAPNPSMRFTAAQVRRQPWFIAQTYPQYERKQLQQQLQQHHLQQNHLQRQAGASLPARPHPDPIYCTVPQTGTEQQARICDAVGVDSSPGDDVRRHLEASGKGRFALTGDNNNGESGDSDKGKGSDNGRRSLTLETIESDLHVASTSFSTRGRHEKSDGWQGKPEFFHQNPTSPSSPQFMSGMSLGTDFSSCSSTSVSTTPGPENGGTSSPSPTPQRSNRGSVEVRRLGTRRLLFSVPAEDHADLTKGLQRALESIGCTCRTGPTYHHADKRIALECVKACRDVVSVDGSRGVVKGGRGAEDESESGSTAVCAVFRVLLPGETPLPDAMVNPSQRATTKTSIGGRGHARGVSGGSGGRGDSGGSGEFGAGFPGDGCHGSNATNTVTALASCGSSSSTDSGEFNVPEVSTANSPSNRSTTRSDSDNSRTDVLVVLDRGQIGDFNRLIEDLLMSEGGISIFGHFGLHPPRGIYNGGGAFAIG